jgi:hypothetical protein
MQLSAMLLFCVGVAFVFPWAALLYLLARISPVLLIPRHPVAWVVALCIIVAPGLVAGAFALRMRRVIIVQCHKCKWKQKLLY